MCDERLLKAIDANGPTGREIILLSDMDDTVRLSSKIPTSVSSFQLRWGIESRRGGGWGEVEEMEVEM